MNYMIKTVLFTALALSLCACSKRNEKASNIDPRTGKHPSGWVVANIGGSHSVAFLNSPSACYECHGKDLKGGISAVSCFNTSHNGMSCHAGGPSGHPAGWASADAHGKAAKTISAGMNGYAHCQVCHGTDFSGGNAKKSCFSTSGCHGTGIMAPHSQKPWSDVGKTGARSHASTDSSNAVACAVCHAKGANAGITLSPVAPTGTAPGCFNNTLCHGVKGHAAGWKSYSSHGRAAKAAVGGIIIKGLSSPISSFGACAVCHGVAYNGGIALQTCLNDTGCHGTNVAAPHPARPWRSLTGGTTHTNTDTSNADQCVACHTAGSNSTRIPRAGDALGITSCFNNTLCHGLVGHISGWSAAALHGAAAKDAPTTNTGFSACQICHGSTFNNGAPPSCTNELGCHGLFVSSPHPAKPWSSTLPGASSHTTTNPANAVTCSICHTAGANSTVVPRNATTGVPGCFNNTLCHFHQIPYAPPAVLPTVHGGVAKLDLRVCQGCHGISGTIAFDGQTLSGGEKTIACSSCHAFAKAHPTDWQGSGIYSHRTAGNIANSCTLCHDVSLGRTAPLSAAPSCFRTTFTNGQGQVRTCHSNGAGVAPHAVPYNNHNSTARTDSTYCLGCHQIASNVTTLSGKVISSCLTCHLTDPTLTSSGCTSCHANPPIGTSYPNIAAAHGPHASPTKVAAMPLTCNDCHAGLGFGTVDHQTRAKARIAAGRANPVAFSSGVLLVAGGGTASSFNDTTGQCANVYCHGAKMPGGDVTGANIVPSWSATLLPATLSAAACGTCHGFPPSAVSGHPVVTIPAGFPGTATIGTTCSCHTNINTAGNSYSNIFVDKSKHINGLLEISGGSIHVFPYGGSVHKPGGTGALLSNIKAPYTSCNGCHDATTTGGTYPVASGVKPLCSACHLTMANFTGSSPGCWDCHGSSATNGRPNGSTFPNRNGDHGTHSAITNCDYCHFGGGTGTAGHGNSNRIMKAVKDVKIAKNPARYTAADTITITQNTSTGAVTCNGSCHIGTNTQSHNESW